MDDDLIYWDGIAVGVQDGNHIVWFSCATPEIIASVMDAKS